MNHLLVLFLALWSALSTATAVYLYVRMRRLEASWDIVPEAQAEDNDPAPYETAAIDQYLYDRCCRYMTERRPFLVESFTLQDLANAVYTNKAYLSKTINRFSGKNFRQYVNYYRVMYSMELFRNNMSLRISALAELSGFRSETSYLQSFKKVMGEQPSHWCARMRRKYNKRK